MLFDLLVGALSLDKAAFLALEGSPPAQRAAILILIAAGLSRTAAQSLALFLNGVRPAYFAVSLALNALIYAIGVGFWSLCIWLVTVELFDQSRTPNLIFAVVALAHSPYVFGLLSLAPYVGAAWDRLLGVWTLLCIVLGLVTVLDLPFWPAAGAGFLGWIVVYVLSLLLSPILSRLTTGLRRLAAGRGLPVGTDNLIADLRRLFKIDHSSGRPR